MDRKGEVEGAWHTAPYTILPRRGKICYTPHMRYAILLALLALGAAPPTVSDVAECRLPHDAALDAVRRLPVPHRKDQHSEDGYTHMRTFDPHRVKPFGFAVRAFNVTEVDAISHESLDFVAMPDAPYATVRTAALASRGKSECDNREDAGTMCVIERRQEGWSVSLILQETDTGLLLSCSYLRRVS